MSSDEVLRIYQLLSANGIKTWLVGGWGIDALLGEQTRQHKDLDVIILLDDVVPLRLLLSEDGFTLKELWSENMDAVDARGNQTATAFVLRDEQGHELDVHAMRLDERGDGSPAWVEEEDFSLTREELSGVGRINGSEVRCMSAQKQALCHVGYVLPEYQKGDLQLLHTRLGVELPQELMRLVYGKDQGVAQ